MSAQDATVGLSMPPPADLLPRLLAGPAAGRSPGQLAAHLTALGPPPYRGAPGLLTATVEAAGLTGRGGAGFPLHRKLRAVAASGRRPVVVANGAEGEPASSKDQALLWTAPHLVLDGLQLAAEAVGAHRAYLYAPRLPALEQLLRQTLAERSAARLDRVCVELVPAPPRFLSGEESALVSHVSGGLAVPRYTPPRVFDRGVRGAPTLVSNVETLAHLSLIARYGADWFRGLGTREEPGTMLCTVSGAVAERGVLEIAVGTPVQQLFAAAGGTSSPVQAVLFGGYHGTWLAATQAMKLSMASADLAAHGAILGTGVVVALPTSSCGLVEVARVVRYLADEGAGQCGPCLNGLPAIAGGMEQLATPGRHVAIKAKIERWSGLVEGRGACRHPDGTVRFVRSSLVTFAAELHLHESGRCSATDRRPFLPVPRAHGLTLDERR